MTAMRVLNVVTNQNARFFQQQVAVLERQGVDSTTLYVGGSTQSDDTGEQRRRSLTKYLRLYPSVLRHSFDEYDLVHANYGLTAPAALAQPNLPVVVSLWGSDLMGRLGPVSKLCASRADAVIVMSDAMATELGMECHVVPHGVNMEMFQPMPKEEARLDAGWRPDAAHVLFPYSPERSVKDYPRAERVVERARERLDVDVELQTLFGVPHERVAVYLNAADALLLTSKREGSPNSVKEAMACNVPVVATDVGDVRQRLEGVDQCHVCRTDAELVDGLVSVIQRGEPSTGREAIEPLSVERMGERIREIYRSVVA